MAAARPFRLATLALVLLLAACGGGDKVEGQTTQAGQDADTGGIGTLDDADATVPGSDDTSTPDGDDAAATDDTAADTGSDTADVPLECPGSPGCACVKNDECDTGICLEAAAGKQCAKLCVDESGCAKGYACEKFGSGDGVFVCVPTLLALCAPCQANADCQVQGVKDALCLDYGADGHFCGGPCSLDADCPAGFGCQDATDPGTGKTSKQCRREAGSTCDCSAFAKGAGTFQTSCSVANALGTCPGTRKCGPDGLTPCSAKQAAVEVCNAEDDDCDGKIDDLPAEATCTKKAYLDTGSQAACAGDGDCPAGEGCDAAVCKTLIGACPGTPTCTSAGVLVCLDAQTPKVESCNAADDDCDGQTDDLACDDGDACSTDTCASASGQCSHAPAIDCDDQDPCTADSCVQPEAGKPDTAASGQCLHTAVEGSCSDGNACTVGDFCQIQAGGAAACLPGAQTPACDDANPCTDDACDPAVGCVQLPNAATLTCFSADAALLGTGTCKAGSKLCAAGVLGAECLGEVVPNAADLCDGLDDDCDGQTDEGCAPAEAEIAFASMHGTVDGPGGTLQAELGGQSPQGAGDGDKHSFGFGFLHFLLSLLDGK